MQQQVGVGNHDRSALAQVCIVNFYGETIYLKYVKTLEKVAGEAEQLKEQGCHHHRKTLPWALDGFFPSLICCDAAVVIHCAMVTTDYRTHVSGVRAEHLRKAATFWEVQKEVSDLTKDKIIVGHALHNDLKVCVLAPQPSILVAGFHITPLSCPVRAGIDAETSLQTH